MSAQLKVFNYYAIIYTRVNPLKDKEKAFIQDKTFDSTILR